MFSYFIYIYLANEYLGYVIIKMFYGRLLILKWIGWCLAMIKLNEKMPVAWGRFCLIAILLTNSLITIILQIVL